MKQYYIQYHNADKMGYLPDADSQDVKSIRLKPEIRDNLFFFTKRHMVNKAVGENCFMIVGVRGKSRRSDFYLWSSFRIDSVKRVGNRYNAFGTGFNFEQPILLNELPGFSEFKSACANFVTFQNISKHQFCKLLVEFTDNASLELAQLKEAKTEDLLLTALEELNSRMQHVTPEKMVSVIELTLRKDQTIVSLLKQVANYQCQFPDCCSEVRTKSGQNYVEVAHVKPVNEGGQSILGNLIVLCPNHHKEFDYGDLQIREQTLSRLNGFLNGREFTIDLIGAT
ncbi:HNH endonuclease [Pontibacter sp. FD36]|uniref:HNH endonuclease n=1 Tax=Pontibacter sp. FD36 TaxID=2789860 RepID=UPI0018A96F11|nr:HNH endonuclease [Pontibacter sp. FD36]MBF8962990.1 HNH endonuclease [Pontibacter sp. FD36]